MKWMLYGATGYTGRLIIESAVKHGHRPVLAGRNVDKLHRLSRKYDLPYIAFHLDDVKVIGEAIAEMDVVFHAAGPFVNTSDPMIRACLATSTHYLDMTGEISVFENTFSYDRTARANGVALISGAGFDVVPSDCLASYVARQIPGASNLEIGVIALSSPSAGTAKSALEAVNDRIGARRHGKLVNQPFASLSMSLTFDDKTYDLYNAPWGDLATAYRTTGIPNITTYLGFSPTAMRQARLLSFGGGILLKPPFVRRMLANLIERTASPPDAEKRKTTRSYVWARASNTGSSAEAWLETIEIYDFTAEVAILAVEHVLETQPIGALSPAQAFGTDFVLRVRDTYRVDA